MDETKECIVCGNGTFHITKDGVARCTQCYCETKGKKYRIYRDLGENKYGKWKILSIAKKNNNILRLGFPKTSK